MTATYVAPVAVVEGPIEVEVRARSKAVRHVATVALLTALAVALWTQHELIQNAIAQMKSMSIASLVLLVALAAYERVSRAEIVRRLLGGTVTLGRAVTVHDVGTAVSKGVPLGGALGTAVRWSIARDSGVPATRFSTMLIAYGIATTFVAWLLPFSALALDLTQRTADLTDVFLLGGIAVVVAGSALFWMIVLRSERLEAFATRRLRRTWSRLAKRVPSLGVHDPAAGVADVRGELHAIARKPWALLAGAVAAQACGALILLVALRSVGVGDELGMTEFFRVFFITHLIGTFAPTPGGVGVVEAGMTGALIAAGVDTTSALAGVLVYRFLTYVLPILFGAVLYAVWRGGRTNRGGLLDPDVVDTALFIEPVRVRGARAAAATLATNGPSFDTALPYLPRAAHQGLRERRDRR